jgi:hypothetical protein
VDTNTDTQTKGSVYAVEMGSGAMIYTRTSGFIKIIFRHSEVDGWEEHTESMVIPYVCFYFFKRRKVG